MKLRTLFSLAFALVVLPQMLLAQPAFREAWNYTFPFAIDNRDSNWEQTLAFGRNETEAAMIDGRTGKLLWRYKFADKFGIKEMAYRTWRYDEHLMIFGNKETKKVPSTIFFVDDRTGELLWKTDQYGGYNGLQENFELEPTHKNGVLMVIDASGTKYLDTRTGKELDASKATAQMEQEIPGKPLRESSLEYDSEYNDDASQSGYHVKVTYSAKRAQFSNAANGSDMEVTVSCAGEAKWSVARKVKVTRNLCSRFGANIYGDIFINIDIIGNKVFLTYEGMTVFDLKTGKVLWETSFDNSDLDFGLKLKQTLGRAGKPLVTESAVYLADFSKDQYVIKMLDLQTGKELWRTTQFNKEAIVPSLSLDGKVLLAQFGGRIIRQTYFGGETETCTSEPVWTGPYGVKAFDAGTGKMLWETSTMKTLPEKFSDRVSNVLSFNGLAIVANENSLYGFEAATGTLKYHVPLGKSKIGESLRITQQGNNILVFAEEGVASVQATDGKLVYATPTGGNFGTFTAGDAFFMWTGPKADDLNEFVRIDLQTGAILGKQKDTPKPYFTPDGTLFIRYDGNKYYQYHTK